MILYVSPPINEQLKLGINDYYFGWASPKIKESGKINYRKIS
jgi:hypothetical protein